MTHLPILLLLLLVDDAPPPRLLRIDAVNRFGERLEAVEVCAVAASACDALRRSGSAPQAPFVLPAAAVRVRLSSPGFESKEVDVPGDLSVPVEVRLAASGSVAASAVSRDLKRGSSLDVTLRPAPPAGGRKALSKRLTLPPAGRAEEALFDDVPAGRWILTWSGPDVALGEKAVEVGDRRVAIGRLPLSPGILVEGVVRDDLGTPIGRATITLPGETERPDLTVDTGDDGRFVVRGVPISGRYAWRAHARGFISADGDLGGETLLEITLDRAEKLVGEVVDENGKAVEGARLDLTYSPEKGSFLSEGGDERTDAAGAFTLIRSRRFKALLTVHAEGFRPHRRVLAEAGAASIGRETDLGTIRLERGRSLRGRVTDGATGEPISEAAVTVSAPSSSSLDGLYVSDGGRATTGADGRYEIGGLPRKQALVLQVSRDGYATASRRTSLEDEILDVALGAGGRVAGRVCGDALVLSSTQVELDSDGPQQETKVRPGADGSFEMLRVEAGRWRAKLHWAVFALDGSLRTYTASAHDPEADFVVRDGQTTHVSLGCDGLPVSGRLVHDGRSLAGARAWLRDADQAVPGALLGTDAEGRFSTRVAAPGRYYVSVWSPDGRGFLVGATPCDVSPGGGVCIVDVKPQEPSAD